MGKQKAKPPTVYVIAGPNGAGKTTFASRFLPGSVQCREFLNADLIAAGLSPFAPETQNIQAGRLLLKRIQELSGQFKDFGFETTFSGRTYVRLMKGMREKGYRIILFYLWVPTSDMAVVRVQNRVKQGGHDVPQEDIHRRYRAGLRNFFELYRPLSESWRLYSASHTPPRLIAFEVKGRLRIKEISLYEQIERQAKKIREEGS